MSNLLEKLRRVKFDDIKEIWKLPVSLLIAPIYRLKHKDLWIVCEDENEARNTYFFIRTIEYSEYCHLDSRTKKYVYTYKFPVTFYTSKSGTNANATLIDIRDLGGKFNRKLLGFGVEVPTGSEP